MTDKTELIDDALAKVAELGTVGAMKWLGSQYEADRKFAVAPAERAAADADGLPIGIADDESFKLLLGAYYLSDEDTEAMRYERAICAYVSSLLAAQNRTWLSSIDSDGYCTDQERMAARILLKIAAPVEQVARTAMLKCDDGGDCGAGGYCPTCPARTASAAPEVPGAHHLTPEDIEALIADLQQIEDGTTERPTEHRDMRAYAGVLHRVIAHLCHLAATPPAHDQGARDAMEDTARMDWIERAVKKDGFLYLHHNKPANMRGLNTGCHDVRTVIDDCREREGRALRSQPEQPQKGPAQ